MHSQEGKYLGRRHRRRKNSLEVIFSRIFYILVIHNSPPVTSLPPLGLELNKSLIPQHSHNSYQGGGGVVLCAQLCLTLCKHMDYSPPGSSVPWNSLGKNSGVGCISFSMGSSWPRGQTRIRCICCIGRRILYHCSLPGCCF